MTYYLKYRPKTLNELDLTSVRESLKKIVKSKNIPHAFLFSGPKGSGKTSAARILAKIVNCESKSAKLRGPGKLEPCNRCSTCKSIAKGNNIDVIELDAASHRGIDDVRSLRDAVKLASVNAKKKVYIIDESHMLTLEASNALLKTLEEPPDHVMFILATTNPEKLISTIRSRSTDIHFTKAKDDEILRSLKRVKKGEKIKIDNQSLSLIAKVSDGSFRDAVKTLEQLVSENIKLDVKGVEKFLFGKLNVGTETLIEHLRQKNTKEALDEVEKIYASGGSMRALLESLISRFREALLFQFDIEGNPLDGFSKNDLSKLIILFSKAASELSFAVVEQIPVELAIIEWCEAIDNNSGGNGEEEQKDENNSEDKSKKNEGTTSKRKKEIKSNGNKANKVSSEIWVKILSQVKPKNSSTEALLRATHPICFDGKILTLGVYYSFHKEQLETKQHRAILEEVVMGVFGEPVRVCCKLSQPKVKKDTEEKGNESEEPDLVLTEEKDDDIIKVAEEIFGS